MTAPLNQVISRQKARWLKFVMHESIASATEKCLLFDGRMRTRRLSGMRRDFLKNLVTKLSMKPDSIVGERATPMSGNLL